MTKPTVGVALLVASLAGCLDRAEPESVTEESELIAFNGPLWTENGNVVPMCWDEFAQFNQYFDKAAAIRAAKSLIVAAAQEWADPLQLTVTWESCPTSGTSQHVRVYVRADYTYGGNGLTWLGMEGLTSPAERAVYDPDNKLRGMLLAFPTNFQTDGATLARILTLHEFGHALGFSHEHVHPDGTNELDACYDIDDPYDGGPVLGPPDPLSIMGWSDNYCHVEDIGLTEGDIAGARLIYGTRADGLGATTLAGIDGCGDRCRLADVDGDGLDDLISPTGTGSYGFVYVQRNLGGSFAPSEMWSGTRCTGQRLCEFADVDGDHAADLVQFVRGSTPVVNVALSTGSGFATATQWTNYACLTGEVCKLADLNGDARSDIVVFTHNAAHQVWVRYNNAYTLAFGPSQLVSTHFCLPGESCDVGDFDGDHYADLVAYAPGGAAWVSYGSYGGTFTAPVATASAFCAAGEACFASDINGDLRTDLVAFGHGATSSGVRVIRAELWARGFHLPVEYAQSGICGTTASRCLLGQIDGAWGVDAVAINGSTLAWQPSEP